MVGVAEALAVVVDMAESAPNFHGSRLRDDIVEVKNILGSGKA